MPLLFCDESGDPGPRAQAGASAIYVVCLVMYVDGKAAQRFHAADADLRFRLGWRREFRWSKMSQRSRNIYFESLKEVFPIHHAVVWDKSRALPASVPGCSIGLEMMQEAMLRLGGASAGSRLVIDGVRHRDRSSLARRILGLADVRYEASHTNPHLQLADMLAGFHAWDFYGKLAHTSSALACMRTSRSVWR